MEVEVCPGMDFNSNNGFGELFGLVNLVNAGLER